MRRALVVLVLVFAFVFTAQPVLAVAWGPNSTYYDGSKRATGWGDFYNSLNTYAKNKMTVRDDRNDGNNVYGKTEFFFYYYKCTATGSCSTDWNSSGTRSTGEWANTTKTVTVSMPLYSTGTKARGKSFACAQMGWPVPDSCAAAAYPSFDY